MALPRLYHDIDGVLFGEYTTFPGARTVFQLRPGTRDWLQWVLPRFELVWLTTWSAEDLRGLLTHLYLSHVWTRSRYLPWQTDLTLGEPPTKLAALQRDLHGFSGPWCWIDDFPEGLPNLDPWRQGCVRVSASGRDALLLLPDRLRRRLTLAVPPE